MAKFWINPDPNDTQRLNTLAVMMGFEFIMVHSGVFMAVMPKKLSLFVFAPVYGLFALAMNAAAPGNAILWLYLGAVFLRMRFAFSNPNESEKMRAATMSVIAAVLYFILIFVFAFGSDLIPRFGLTDNFLVESGYRDSVTSGGLFIDLPHVPMAMGVVYFSLIALLEALFLGSFGRAKSNLFFSQTLNCDHGLVTIDAT